MQERENRRAVEHHGELRGSLREAEKALRANDPRAAAEVLKRAGVKAATMWGGVGVPAMPQPVRDLIILTGDVQTLPARDGLPGSADPLLERLDGIRSAFDQAAESETGTSPY